MAQKELQKALKRSKTQVKNIESHIKEASAVLEKKKKLLVQLEPKAETAEKSDKKVESNDFEMDLSQKTAVKKEALGGAKKETSAADEISKTQKDESDKKDDVKKDQNTFDIQSLTEKNNKMWDVKFKEAK